MSNNTENSKGDYITINGQKLYIDYEADDIEQEFKGGKPNLTKSVFFPLTTNVMWRDDFNLWDTIGKYTKPLFKKYRFELYDPAVEALNTIPSVDVRFAALIEFGNAVFINEYRDSFKRINRYLTEIIMNRDPDIILAGLKNYLITYCDKEGSEYYPDYGLCYRSRGTLINILKLLNDFKDIKGGDEEIKKDVNSFYRTFMKKLYKNKMIPASWLENIIL